MAGDPRFRIGVNLDGKLFGNEPESRLDRPFLWIQSGDAKTAEYMQGRDRFFEGLRAGGSLVTVRGSTHMSFTDGASYLTSLGRRIAGGRDRRLDLGRGHDCSDGRHDRGIRRPALGRAMAHRGNAKSSSDRLANSAQRSS